MHSDVFQAAKMVEVNCVCKVVGDDAERSGATALEEQVGRSRSAKKGVSLRCRLSAGQEMILG